jgi:hypothetical protein
LAFENFAVSIEKSQFRSKFLNSVGVENEKNSSTKFLHPLGKSIFKKPAKSQMVTGHLVDSYKKTALKSSSEKF